MTAHPFLVSHNLLLAPSVLPLRRRQLALSPPTVSHSSTTCTSYRFTGNVGSFTPHLRASSLLLTSVMGKEAREPPDPPDPPDPPVEEAPENQPPPSHQSPPPTRSDPLSPASTHDSTPPWVLFSCVSSPQTPHRKLALHQLHHAATPDINPTPTTLDLLHEPVPNITDNQPLQPPASRSRARNGNRQGTERESATVNRTPVSTHGSHNLHDSHKNIHLAMGQKLLLLGQDNVKLGQFKLLGLASKKLERPHLVKAHLRFANRLRLVIDCNVKSSGTEDVSASFFKAQSQARPPLVEEQREVHLKNFPMVSTLNYPSYSTIALINFVMYLNIFGSISLAKRPWFLRFVISR